MTSPISASSNQTPIQRAWKINPGLTALSIFSLILVISSILGLIIDPRTTAILGTPTWVKTFKFSVSTRTVASIEVSSGTLVVFLPKGTQAVLGPGETFSLPKP